MCGLQNLKTNNDIVVRQANKGGGIVILDKDKFIEEALRQLIAKPISH